MSEAHNYHQPYAPDSPTEESDSDIDLDLQELDPAPSQGPLHEYGNEYGGREKTGRRIPLRNLRAGKRGENRLHASGDLRVDSIDENPLGLRQGDANLRVSSSSVEDEAPLLGSGSDQVSSRHTARGLRGLASSKIGYSNLLSRIQSQKLSRSGSKSRSQGSSRNFTIGQYPPPRFPPNAVSNAKYTPWSFLPRTLYNEFSFFFNLYFLLVALSQIISPLRIGYLSTYVAPLAFVLAITLGKEALDDIARRRRDNEANNEGYTVLRLRDPSQSLRGKRDRASRSKRFSSGLFPPRESRLDAIIEEESNTGESEHGRNIEVDEITIKSRELKVGDVLRLGKDQRVPADLVILKSYVAETVIAPSGPLPPERPADGSENLLGSEADSSTAKEIGMDETLAVAYVDGQSRQDTANVGEAFIRTDQLDGETDWKLRLASPLTQSLDSRSYTSLRIVAGKPDKKLNEFVGTLEYMPPSTQSSNGGNFDQAGSHRSSTLRSAPLTIDNTAWANTVLASNATVLAVVVYTGAQTRQAMSTSQSRSKTGLLEREINNLTKILCALTMSLSIILVALEGFENRKDQKWYVAIMRFLILFSTIIPISLRVNLDMGKTVYAWFIERDQDIPDTVVRTSTIPEELGRIEYLLSDKTGTLTQNGMKVLHPLSFVLLLTMSKKCNLKRYMLEPSPTPMKPWKRSQHA